MCGRYVLSASAEEITRYFAVDHVAAEVPVARYNVAPSQFVPGVALERDSAARRLELFSWGLVPNWSEDPTLGGRMINARAESVATSRAFRDAFATRRCLVPANGFYEWQAAPAGSRGRLPWYFHRRDGELLALAGVWERWRRRDGSWLLSCSVLTSSANALVAPVHDRMPVLITPEHFATWLERRPLEDAERTALLAPAPEELLASYRIGTAVSNVANEGPELLKEFQPA